MSKVKEWFSRTSKKAEDAIEKVQETLENSNEGIKTLVKAAVIAVGVNAVVNIITLSLNIANYAKPRNHCVYNNYYILADMPYEN